MNGTEPQPQGAIGAVANVSGKLITALPPAFIVLVLLNAALVGMAGWFLDDQLRQRDEMARQLFNRCMAIALGSTP
jgi:hypothetical protein